MKEYLLGFDIGGTKCAVVLGQSARAKPRILGRIEFPTANPEGCKGVLRGLETNALALLPDNKAGLRQAKGLGISCGGPLDSKMGIILSPPNLPGWDRVEIVKYFKDRLGLPVRLENDANACAVAEFKWGAGRGSRNMVFLTFGTGLGAGLILDGKLYRGASDMAGEVGHVRLAEKGPIGYGKPGSFEGFCSGGGLAQLGRVHGLKGMTAKSLALAAARGDSRAREVWRISAERLGQGLALLIDVLNPDRIVIGSIFARQRRLLWPGAEKVIKREALKLSARACKVVPAGLGEVIGDFACLSLALGE